MDKTEFGFREGTAIYLNEHLTPHNSRLAYISRQLKNKGFIKQIRTFKGIVKILFPDVNGELMWDTILHQNDFIKIFPDLRTIVDITFKSKAKK